MGPLDGLRIIEVAGELSCWAGKLCADMGADVVVVEPPGGHRMRTYEPFVDDEAGAERSLYWWNYNTSKRGVTLDLDSAEEIFQRSFDRYQMKNHPDQTKSQGRHDQRGDYQGDPRNSFH